MKKRLNRIKTFLSKPYNVLLIILLVVLTYLVVLPLLSIIRDTFVVHASEKSRIKQPVGSFTMYHWLRAFRSNFSTILVWEPLWHSLYTSVLACAVAILIGGGFAWLVTRTDLLWKHGLTKLFIFPYIMPSWTLALAWRNFFKNAVVGGAPGIFTALTGIPIPNWFAYGPFPIVVTTGLHYAPFAYILIGGVLRNMDANLEEAAIILKTNKARMFTSITIPMVMPAVMSTIILVFSSAMSSFAVPQFLGLPVRYYVLTTEMYSTIQGTNPGVGYIIAILMIVISVAIMMINQRMIGTRKSYATVTGKSANISLFHLKRGRVPVSALVGALVLCMSLIPMISFVLQSLILTDGNYHLSNMTLDFWIGTGLDKRLDQGDSTGILLNPKVWNALGFSLLLAITCALVAGTSGILVGYGVAKRRGSRLSSLVNNLSFFPYLMPSLAFGAIYLAMASKISWLSGFLLLALVGSVKYLPFASRSGVNAMLQLSGEIEEAAVITGVPWWKRMLRVIFPIQKSSFLSGYLLPMVSCMRELSLFVLLVPSSNTLLTTMLMQYSEKGWAQFGNAINLLIIIVVLLVNYTVNKLTGASIDKGVGG